MTKKIEKPVSRPMFYHHKAFGSSRGFTVAAVIEGDHLQFGMAIKIPIEDKCYVKNEGRKYSEPRAKEAPYKRVLIGKRRPSTLFYKEIERLKPWFENFAATTKRCTEDYNDLIKFIKKHKVVKLAEKVK